MALVSLRSRYFDYYRRHSRGQSITGMEFVLTYYDEPAVGGLPHGVAAWATGRAAPAYLQRMRAAALHYDSARTRQHEDLPDFTPFVPKNMSNEEEDKSSRVSEEEMESSKQGPELNGNNKKEERSTREQAPRTDVHTDAQTEERTDTRPDAQTGTPTDARPDVATDAQTDAPASRVGRPPAATHDIKEPPPTSEEDSKVSEENGSWWRYLYPFYYFV